MSRPTNRSPLAIVCRLAFLGLAAASTALGCQIADPAQGDIDRLVPLLCEEARSCFCAQDLGESDCLTSRGELWSERISEGRSRSLAYNASCVEALEQRVPGFGCGAARLGDAAHLCSEFCAVFFGDKQLDEACESFDAVVSDCAPGLTCSNGRCADPCAALTGLLEGDTCTTADFESIEACATGLVCDSTTRLCVRAPGVGESCPVGRCSPDAYCDYNANVCRSRPDVGESCLDGVCVDGLYCRYSDSLPTPTCAQFSEEGDSCQQERRCQPGLECDGNSCRAPAEAGESCGTISCADGLVCDFERSECVEPPASEGAACPNGVCGGSLWCDNVTLPEGECLPRGELGDACAGHAQCDSAYCPAGRCADRPAQGEDCSGTNICQGGLVCTDNVCELAVGEGAALCVYEGW